MPGYREEKGVSAESITETYAALKLGVDNWRWAGVPFYLRTGKRLAQARERDRRAIPPHAASRVPAQPRGHRGSRNRLILRIQPDEGIALQFGAKLPGAEPRIKAVEMDFDYHQAFGSEPPEAYERLLLDAMKGDATLYARGDWVDLAWELLEPVLQGWAVGDPRKFPNYEAGTWGTAEADTLIEREGRDLETALGLLGPSGPSPYKALAPRGDRRSNPGIASARPRRERPTAERAPPASPSGSERPRERRARPRRPSSPRAPPTCSTSPRKS